MPKHKTEVAIIGLLILCTSVVADSPAIPLPIPFHDNDGHGPDGPWNYITLNVGTNPISSVDFYPMFMDHANLLITQNACSKTSCISPTPNYYNQNSKSATNTSIDRNTTSISSWTSAFQLGLQGSGIFSTDEIHNPIEFHDILSYISNDTTATLGNMTYTPVSLFSLEPFLTSNVTKERKTGNFLKQNTLFESLKSQVPNVPQSFGLHMGSTKFKQSGSLFLGGYDAKRLIERPAIYHSHGQPNLTGISISSTGAPLNSSYSIDPWASLSKKPGSNLLPSQLSVYLSPHVPNLLLPKSVCQAIAAFLPVNYDASTNLYLWNTSSSLYTTITKSSTPIYHLSFTFDDISNTTIKVPFSLLDLTLTKPIKDTPTAYFPCESRNDTLNLGRAFLQATMLMQTYNPDTIVIGQAPGPSVNQTNGDPRITTLSDAEKIVIPSDAPKWADTWIPFLAASGNSNDTNSTGAPTAAPKSTGLSPGGIAGIVFGCIVGVAFVAGIIWLDLKRQGGKKTGIDKETIQAPMDWRNQNGVALRQYNQYAGVNDGYRPPRPPRPPTYLGLLDA